MPLQDSCAAPVDRWIDRWGHFVLWMGPLILIVSLLLWTPHLIPLMVGIELVQFIFHVSRHHPEHLMADVLPLFVAGIILILGVALIPLGGVLWLLVLIGSQIGFSSTVHRWIHSDSEGDRGKLLMNLVSFPVLSTVAIFFLIGDGDVPGLPLLRTFLL